MYITNININNKDDCVKCAAFIESLLQKKENLFDGTDIAQAFQSLSCSLVRPNNRTLPFVKFDEPLKENVNAVTYINEWGKHIKSSDMRFHIRVHGVSENDLSYLHYITLLIYRFRDFIKMKRLTLFMVPETGSAYPYETADGSIDLDTYKDASQYLRSIIGEGKFGFISGVKKKKTENDPTIVKALDFGARAKATYFFPVIVFEQKTQQNNIYESYINATKEGTQSERHKHADLCKGINNYALLFEEKSPKNTEEAKNILHQYLDIAFRLKGGRRFGFADYNHPEIALTDYIFETAFFTVQDKFCEKGLDIKDVQKELKKEFSTANLFSFAVFSLIFVLDGLNKEEILDNIKQTAKFSVEIGESIKQIAQNSIQHSSAHISVISLYLQEKDEKQRLHIIVSDISDKSIADTFLQNITEELNYIASNVQFYSKNLGTEKYYDRIIASAKKANCCCEEKGFLLNGLLNDFTAMKEEVKAYWKDFRTSDSSAHMGLALFANSVIKHNGTFSLSSHSTYLNGDDKSTFLNYKKGEELYSVTAFPGTQFHIELPVKDISYSNGHGISKLRNQYFNENYDSFKKYLGYSLKYIASPLGKRNFQINFNEIQKTITNNDGTVATDKFKQLMLWTNFWLSALDKIDRETRRKNTGKYVYYIDFGTICNRANQLTGSTYEVLAKGLINALGIAFDENNSEILFALRNADQQFVKMFIQVSTSLAVKKFPKNIQFFLVDEQNENQLHLFGTSYADAIRNSYIISIENGTKGYDGRDLAATEKLTSAFELQPVSDENKKVDMFPFISLLKRNGKTLFFDSIASIADNDITQGNGYKFSHSHTRIGNKVHIDSFYEMSYLFYRTLVANNVAMYILKDLKENRTVDFKKDHILFYGYAAYSQAILTSLVNIADGNDNLLYASFLYNIQNSTGAHGTKIYVNNRKELEKITEKQTNGEESTEAIKVVQIVPISSTMTTFSKMWASFKTELKGNFNLVKNYTVFHVTDFGDQNLSDKYYIPAGENCVETTFSNLDTREVHYILTGGANWEKPEKCEKCFPPNILNELPLVETDQTSTVPSQQIYLEKEKTKQTPCVGIDEQKRLSYLLGHVHYGHFRRGKNHFQYYIDTQEYFNSVSGDVAAWLTNLRKKDKSREQYPEKTTQVTYPCLDIIFSPIHNSNVGFSQYVNSYYFSGTAEIISVDEDKIFRSNFICEHNELRTTIERLTEDYYEVNTDSPEDNYRPVRFIFVDDNLISGETFRKASGLLQSLLPERIRKRYTTNIFEKCFVLINRLSDASIHSYILEKADYHAFCQLDISNMRTQGDSCVGCKLRKTAERLYTRSSTQYAANYWANKYKHLRETIPGSSENSEDPNNSYLRMILSHIFKNYIQLNDNSKDYFGVTMYFVKFFTSLPKEEVGSGSVNIQQKKYLRDIRPVISISFADDELPKKIGTDTLNNFKSFATNKNIIKCILKIIARPFFVFNQGLKAAALKFFVILSETILCEQTAFSVSPSDTDTLEAIKTAKAIKTMFSDPEELLQFLKDYVFEALADLQSTYLLREATMEKVVLFINKILDRTGEAQNEKTLLRHGIEEFFMDYSICVQRIVDSGTDETRALWLEKLLITGNESEEQQKKDNTGLFFSEIILQKLQRHQIDTEVQNQFKAFCCEIFLSNGFVLYDGIARSALNFDEGSDYFMERWKDFRTLDNKAIGLGVSQKAEDGEMVWYNFLKKKNTTLGTVLSYDIITERYRVLLENLNEMLSQRYGISRENIHLSLLNCTKKSSNLSADSIKLRDLDFVWNNFGPQSISFNRNANPTFVEDISLYKYSVKRAIVQGQTTHAALLERYGYYIHSAERDTSEGTAETAADYLKKSNYFILKFDNHGCEPGNISKKEVKRINPVYLFVNLEGRECSKLLVALVMRDILLYRNKLMNYFQEDFTSDVMQRYAHNLDKEAILENEKVVSHSSIRKDTEEIKELIKIDQTPLEKSQKHFDRIKDWVLARNYCNMIIAKLYNRVFRNIDKPFKEIISNAENEKNTEVYHLYVTENNEKEHNMPLTDIFQLLPNNPSQSDVIFELLKEIITFDDRNILLNKPLKTIFKDNNQSNYYFNLEFVKNIIYRICFDALRFCPISSGTANDFIKSINNLYKEKGYQQFFHEETSFFKFFASQKKQFWGGNEICYITFCVEQCPESKNFDWFVIKNRIKGSETKRYDKIELIRMKMEDPLDFTDGHMSLITTKEYLEKLLQEEDIKLLTKMYSYEDNFFVTKLPIIKKGEIEHE